MLPHTHRGVTKRPGGRILLNSHVESVLMEDGRAAGVVLRGGGTVRATRAVVSNASVWDTLKLLPQGDVPEQYRQYKQTAADIPMCPSFMHLHIGFDKTGEASHMILAGRTDDLG